MALVRGICMLVSSMAIVAGLIGIAYILGL